MKKMPLMIAIPFIAVVIVLVGGFAYKMLQKSQPIGPAVSPGFPTLQNNTAGASGTTFGATGQTKVTMPPPPPEINSQLNSVLDDGGKSDLDALDKQASSL